MELMKNKRNVLIICIVLVSLLILGIVVPIVVFEVSEEHLGALQKGFVLPFKILIRKHVC